jgi:hypothetical protein
MIAVTTTTRQVINKAALASLGAYVRVAMLFYVILLGLLHGDYAHAYKDILYLVAGPPSLYYSLNPNKHYPPNDIFFEISGVLDMLTGYFVALSTVRLIRDRQQGDQPSSVQEQARRSR